MQIPGFSRLCEVCGSTIQPGRRRSPEELARRRTCGSLSCAGRLRWGTKTRTERFWDKVDKTGPNGCWLWTGYRDRHGYGRYKFARGAPDLAHRLSYELVVGSIPEGLTLDHLCRNPSCVNPAHLEPVTQRENMRRVPGEAFNRYVGLTHCLNGHPFDAENTAYFNRNHPTWRSCRTCSRARRRSWGARRAS